MIIALLVGVVIEFILILALFNYVVALHQKITKMYYGRNAFGELKGFDD